MTLLYSSVSILMNHKLYFAPLQVLFSLYFCLNESWRSSNITADILWWSNWINYFIITLCIGKNQILTPLKSLSLEVHLNYIPLHYTITFIPWLSWSWTMLGYLKDPSIIQKFRGHLSRGSKLWVREALYWVISNDPIGIIV